MSNHPIILESSTGLPRLGSGRRGANLVTFSRWFLAGGVWDENGIWLNDIPWDPENTPDNAEFFLAGPRLNVFGVWLNDEPLDSSEW